MIRVGTFGLVERLLVSLCLLGVLWLSYVEIYQAMNQLTSFFAEKYSLVGSTTSRMTVSFKNAVENVADCQNVLR